MRAVRNAGYLNWSNRERRLEVSDSETSKAGVKIARGTNWENLQMRRLSIGYQKRSKIKWEKYILTITLQLICPAAHTRGPVLHVSVEFCPIPPSPPSKPAVMLATDPEVELAECDPPTAANAAWHESELRHTLQPKPPHPLGHVQSEDVRFAKPLLSLEG